ncbi:hypothetical protein [Shewanella sp. YIC-542]|uniref:hypothetical protein n=1 Tax=Shewanella mytili TaxID=3377111 RepID=UPI00398F08B5
MNHLFTYALALEDAQNGPAIAAQTASETYSEDDGVVIEHHEWVVEFANGVTLQKQLERDHIDVADDQVCEECWISYRIIAKPEHLHITPMVKNFTNHCQEAFWLKLHKTQAAL